MNKPNDFVEAYTWLYGGSNIEEVIDCYDGNAKEE